MPDWAFELLSIVRRLGKPEFKNDDVYALDRELEQRHPDNATSAQKSASNFRFYEMPVC